MSDNTTGNHGYNVPEKGRADWHVPLNENFEAIDRGVEIRDEADALDDYTPKDGAKFLATDTGAAYVGTGDEWVRVPIPPGQPVDIGGETVIVGARHITGTVDVDTLVASDAIELREGDVYRRIEE